MKICIIGAGPSGVAAATKLIENGFTDLIILEAGPRIGGRINTVPFGTGVVEIGAQFCHGTSNSIVYRLANKHNLLSEMSLAGILPNLFDTDGTIIPKEKAAKLFELANQILESDDTQSYKGSLGNYFMEKYWAALEAETYNDIDDKLRGQYAKYFHKYQNVLDASNTWYLTSCGGKYEEEGALLVWNKNARGFATILDFLQNKYPGQGQPIEISDYTQLNKEVKKIKYDLADSSKLIRIECADGSVCEADHVICTVSLGVLKANHLSLFDPILPEKNFNAIESLNFGVVDKLFIEFDRPFWPDGWSGCSAVWNNEQLKLIRKDEETRWVEGIPAFHPIDNHSNVLIGWITGDNARRMEALPDETVILHIMRWLKMLLKDFEIPDAPKNFRRSRWFSNPLFRGSYSCVSVEMDAWKSTHEHLGEPLLAVDKKRPVIQFAGEATNPVHYATVNGAIESGWREADRLITFLSEKK